MNTVHLKRHTLQRRQRGGIKVPLGDEDEGDIVSVDPGITVPGRPGAPAAGGEGDQDEDNGGILSDW